MKISKNDLIYALKKIATGVNKENEVLLEAGKKSVTLSVFDKETIQMQTAVPAEVPEEECGKRFVTLFSKLSDVVNVWRAETMNIFAAGGALIISEGKVSVNLPFKEDMAELSLEGLVPGNPATIKQSELVKGLKALLPLVGEKFPGIYLEPVEADIKPAEEETKEEKPKTSKKKADKPAKEEKAEPAPETETAEEEPDAEECSDSDSEGFDSEGFAEEDDDADPCEGFAEEDDEDEPCVEENEPKYNATRLWATDGSRMARFTVAGTLGEPVYLPKVFCKVIASLKGELTMIIMGGKYLLIKDTDNTVALISIIAKNFPVGKLGEVIAAYTNNAVATIEVAKNDFISSLSLIQTVSTDEAKKFSLLFTQGDNMMLDLKEENGKVTECLVGTISADTTFEPKFSAEQIRAMVEANPTDKVVMKFTSGQAMLMDDDSATYVVCGFTDTKAKASKK